MIYASRFRADPSAAVAQARRDGIALVLDGAGRPLAMILPAPPPLTAGPSCEPHEGAKGAR